MTVKISDALKAQALDQLNAMQNSYGNAMNQSSSQGVGTLSDYMVATNSIGHISGFGRQYETPNVIGVFKVNKVANGYILTHSKTEYGIPELFICRDAKELADYFITCLTVNRLEK